MLRHIFHLDTLVENVSYEKLPYGCDRSHTLCLPGVLNWKAPFFPITLETEQ